MRYQAEIPEGAQAAVWVQYSQDDKSVCREHGTALADGAHSVELDADGVCWVRLCTKFQSILGEESSALPVLHEYVLETGKEYRWDTLESWRRGTFSGVVGHQDGDVYRDHGEDLPGNS